MKNENETTENELIMVIYIFSTIIKSLNYPRRVLDLCFFMEIAFSKMKKLEFRSSFSLKLAGK